MKAIAIAIVIAAVTILVATYTLRPTSQSNCSVHTIERVR